MYCRNCGSQLVNGTGGCSRCGTRVGMGTNFCSNCGSRMNPGTVFCDFCGANMAAANAAGGYPALPGQPINYNAGRPGNGYGGGYGGGYGVPGGNYGAPRKSKIAAGLLGIFLGSWGIHNFYLGYYNKAIIQLVCTIVGWVICTCSGFTLSLLSLPLNIGISIWGLVEGIMILCGSIAVDGNGVPLE